MSFLHLQRQQCSVAYHALVLVHLLAHGVAPFRLVAIRGFWSNPVAASHRTMHRAYSSHRAMAIKQKLDDEKPVVHSADALRTLLSSAITSYGSVEVALLHVMKTHDFNTSLLQRVLTRPFILV